MPVGGLLRYDQPVVAVSLPKAEQTINDFRLQPEFSQQGIEVVQLAFIAVVASCDDQELFLAQLGELLFNVYFKRSFAYLFQRLYNNSISGIRQALDIKNHPRHNRDD